MMFNKKYAKYDGLPLTETIDYVFCIGDRGLLILNSLDGATEKQEKPACRKARRIKP
jgi:hypothetical protein